MTVENENDFVKSITFGFKNPHDVAIVLNQGAVFLPTSEEFESLSHDEQQIHVMIAGIYNAVHTYLMLDNNVEKKE